jgi:hypothetical protein
MERRRGCGRLTNTNPIREFRIMSNPSDNGFLTKNSADDEVSFDPAQFDRMPKEPETDPFDPANLRLDQDFASAVGAKKLLTTVRVTKPNRHTWVRVRPGEDWRLTTGLFEDKNSREMYLVDRHLWPELGGDIAPVTLFTAITRQKDIFLWPVKLPGIGGRTNDWNTSAMQAATLAQTRWVRMSSNTENGAYDVFEAAIELADPDWPDFTLHQLLQIAFKTRFIKSEDHLILKQLRGEQ